jgi:hypothetical protein
VPHSPARAMRSAATPMASSPIPASRHVAPARLWASGAVISSLPPGLDAPGTQALHRSGPGYHSDRGLLEAQPGVPAQLDMPRFGWPWGPVVPGCVGGRCPLSHGCLARCWLGCSESARQRPARIPIHYMHAPAGHLVQASSRAAFSGLSRCPGGRVEYRTAAWYGCLHSLADPVGGRCRPAYPRGCGPVRGSQRLGAGHGSRGRPRGPVPAADPGHIGPRGDLVVLEGHARLTAFMLARDRLPPELEVLVGSSPAMTHWGLW